MFDAIESDGATPVCRRSSGTWATPRRIASRASPPCSRVPATMTSPRAVGRIPVTVSASSRWPLPATPAIATISPRAHRQRHTAQRVASAVAVAPQVAHLEHRLAELRGAFDPFGERHLAADHQRGERARRRARRFDRLDVLAAAQDGDAVGDGLHLVQLVRDEDDRPPFVRHHPQRLEQRACLLRRQHRRRLVENQDARLAVERLQDLDALLLAERQLPDAGARVDRDAIALPEFRDARLDAPRVHHELPPLAAVIAEDHVLGDRERRHEPEVLMHHADARVERLARRGERDGSTAQRDLAFVGPVEAGQDVRERRLAGAVLAEQRVHLALGCLEVDGVVRDDAREPLRDPAEGDGGRHKKRAGEAGAPPTHRWVSPSGSR